MVILIGFTLLKFQRTFSLLLIDCIFSKILGILLGLLWGLLPLKGFLGLVLFAGISAGIVYVWITAIQVSFHS